MTFTNKAGEKRIARGGMTVSAKTEWQVPTQIKIDEALANGYTCINCFAEGSTKESNAYVTMTCEELAPAIEAELTHFTLKLAKKLVGSL